MGFFFLVVNFGFLQLSGIFPVEIYDLPKLNTVFLNSSKTNLHAIIIFFKDNQFGKLKKKNLKVEIIPDLCPNNQTAIKTGNHYKGPQSCEGTFQSPQCCEGVRVLGE